jgi:stage II sporulation protein AB (anti-sigma F factor)
MSESKRIAMQIPMEPNMELAAIKTAEQVARFMQFAADSIDEITMALVEGIINAFEHSRSPDKTVYIQFNMHDEELEVTIQDYGAGFDAEARSTVLKPLQKRGYGLTLMQALMDHVELISGPEGTKVVMTKRRTK